MQPKDLDIQKILNDMNDNELSFNSLHTTMPPSNISLNGDIKVIQDSKLWFKQSLPVYTGIDVYLVRQPNLNIECFDSIPTQLPNGVWVGDKSSFKIDENMYNCNDIDNLAYKKIYVHFAMD